MARIAVLAQSLTICAVAAMVVPVQAATFSVVANFGKGVDQPQFAEFGLTPFRGALYGTSYSGGGPTPSGDGTAFKVTLSNGKVQTLLDLSTETSGGQVPVPAAPLVMLGGNFCGATYYGGSAQSGTIFVVNPVSKSGSLAYTFLGGADGSSPGQLVALEGVMHL